MPLQRAAAVAIPAGPISGQLECCVLPQRERERETLALPLRRWKRFLLFISPTEIKSKRPNGCLAVRAAVFVYPLQIDAALPGPRASYSILHTPSTSSAPEGSTSTQTSVLWSPQSHSHTALCKLIDFEGARTLYIHSWKLTFCHTRSSFLVSLSNCKAVGTFQIIHSFCSLWFGFHPQL